MKSIALTVATPGLDVAIEPKFGRAPFLLLVDPETMDWSSLENPAREAQGGAGVQVAQVLDKQGVREVISGDFGPKAQAALEAAGIATHRCGPESTVREAVGLLKSGGLGEPPSGAPAGTPSGASAGAPAGASTAPQGSGGGGGMEQGQGDGMGHGRGMGQGRGRGQGRGGGRGQGQGRGLRRRNRRG